MPLTHQTSFADSSGELQKALPVKINGWAAEPKDEVYDRETIFDYINGAGEVYLAYNMQTCLSRRYSRPNHPSIVLDIFHMGSSKDAFGMFTHDQDGEPLEIGQEALYRPGWLSFWKDHFFISIYAEDETPETKQTVKALGKAVAALIKTQGTKPDILSRLPSKGLQPRSVRYLHHHIVLNYHFFVSDTNLLNLGPKTDAVLAGYKRGDESARFLLVMYPDERTAKKAHADFIQHYLPEADAKGLVRIENGRWSAATLKGNLLAIVLEADNRKLADSLLKEATGSDHGR
ncbi:MAG: DUF6599 family protein [Pseudomonadota bacterium]